MAKKGQQWPFSCISIIMQEADMGKYSPTSLIVNIPDDCGYGVKLIHNINLNDTGVPATYVDWMRLNCSGRWGWWFERDIATLYSKEGERSVAHLSFELEEDLVIFSLTHDISY
jgi:hypothetical protein